MSAHSSHLSNISSTLDTSHRPDQDAIEQQESCQDQSEERILGK